MLLLFTFWTPDVYQNTTPVYYCLFFDYYLNVELFYFLLSSFWNFSCEVCFFLNKPLFIIGCFSLINWYLCLLLIKLISKRLFAYSSCCSYRNYSYLVFLLVSFYAFIFSFLLFCLLFLLWLYFFLLLLHYLSTFIF